MARYRRRKYTKRSGRKGLPPRRGMVQKPNKKPIKLKTHTFIRKMARNEIDLTGSYQFEDCQDYRSIKLNQLLNSGEFTALFNEYKIHKVKLTFHWMLNVGAAGATSPGAGYISGPVVNIVKNRYAMDHATTQTEFQEQSQNVQLRLTPYGSKTYSFKPNILGESYRTPTTTGYTPKYDTWINCDDAAVPHFGLDIGVDKMNVFQGKIAVDCEVCFSCKGCE